MAETVREDGHRHALAKEEACMQVTEAVRCESRQAEPPALQLNAIHQTRGQPHILADDGN